MKHYDVIIAGSGLGGLECGYILSKKGYNVCVLEKNPQLGGCLQTFRRGKTEFDTGFHFVGGLDEGQFLHKLFRYYDLLDLPWQRLDDNGFAEVVTNEKSYLLASGYENFASRLSEDFPHQRRQLERYVSFLREVGNNIDNTLQGTNQGTETASTSLFQQSAYNFLLQTIDDPVLRNVLSGVSLTMELNPEKLPLYTFAQINSSFIQSSWRLNGGGSLISDKLAENIRRMGGTVLTRAEVTCFIENEGKITAVEINKEEQISADYVISNLHPALTLSLIPDSKAIRKIYKNRITRLPNTFGMFTTHLQLKENAIPYLNRNVFVYEKENVWNNSYIPGAGMSSALLSYSTPADNSGYTRNIDILTPMHWEQVSQWSDTFIEKRGEEYKAFKQQKAEESIKFAEKKIPGLSQAIERVYTSSPLTYRDYTGTWEGSAYGIRKDYNDIMMTLLTSHTPVQNLLLTGQNLNLHGIMGVSITSLLTCAGIVGMNEIVHDLNQ